MGRVIRGYLAVHGRIPPLTPELVPPPVTSAGLDPTLHSRGKFIDRRLLKFYFYSKYSFILMQALYQMKHYALSSQMSFLYIIIDSII